MEGTVLFSGDGAVKGDDMAGPTAECGSSSGVEEKE